MQTKALILTYSFTYNLSTCLTIFFQLSCQTINYTKLDFFFENKDRNKIRFNLTKILPIKMIKKKCSFIN